jgi:hypothetical protein
MAMDFAHPNELSDRPLIGAVETAAFVAEGLGVETALRLITLLLSRRCGTLA